VDVREEWGLRTLPSVSVSYMMSITSDAWREIRTGQ